MKFEQGLEWENLVASLELEGETIIAIHPIIITVEPDRQVEFTIAKTRLSAFLLYPCADYELQRKSQAGIGPVDPQVLLGYIPSLQKASADLSDYEEKIKLEKYAEESLIESPTVELANKHKAERERLEQEFLKIWNWQSLINNYNLNPIVSLVFSYVCEISSIELANFALIIQKVAQAFEKLSKGLTLEA